jgi:hypothetical protein
VEPRLLQLLDLRVPVARGGDLDVPSTLQPPIRRRTSLINDSFVMEIVVNDIGYIKDPVAALSRSTSRMCV